jgi:hypothetical protein
MRWAAIRALSRRRRRSISGSLLRRLRTRLLCLGQALNSLVLSSCWNRNISQPVAAICDR